MKKVVISLLAATYLGSGAMAADIPSQRQTSPSYIPPAFSWTGFYIGVNAGYAWNGDSKYKELGENGGQYRIGDFANLFGEADVSTTQTHSFTGGIQAGYNHQVGSIVFGLETDFNYVNTGNKFLGQGHNEDYETGNFISYVINGIDLGPGNEISTSEDTVVRLNSKIEWFGTVRGRLGFVPFDRLLVFVTGGLAYGKVKTSASISEYTDVVYDGQAISFPPLERRGSKSGTRVGWTLGAGAEYAIMDNLTVKGEYSYVDLGSKRNTFFRQVDEDGDLSYFTAKDQARLHLVRVGVNYKF